MKKLLATILALVMALGLTAVAWATGEENGEAKPVEYWTGFNNTTDKTDKAFDALDEAITYAKGQTDAVRRVVVAGDYTLSTNVTIPEGIYVDVLGKMTVSDGATVTVSATAKRLGVWNGGTLINNGTILVCGTSATAGKVMVQDGGTFDINTLSVPEGYVLDKNGSNYFAAITVWEITYADGTVKQAGALTNVEGAKSAKLLRDLADFARTFSSTDKLADGFVLDLGGFTLSGKSTASTEVLTISVPMTIQNGTVKYISNNGDNGAVKTSADVTIANNATIDGGVGYGIWTSGYGRTLTVNGTVKSDGDYAITSNGNKDGGLIAECDIVVNDGAKIKAPEGIAIYHPEKGTVTVNGGTISGNTGIQMCAGKLVVKGGSITSSGVDVNATGSQNAILDGGAISIIDRNYPGGTPAMEITGGTVRAAGTGALAVKAYDYKDNTVKEWTNAAGSLKITGGTFSGNVSDYVPDNTPVATVSTQGGGNTYVVGSEAIADAANNDANVTIIKGGAISGVNEGVTIVVDKEVKGVTINNVPVEENKTYIVPAKPSTGGYYYYPSTPGITAELNGTNKSATDYPGGDYGLVFRSTAAFSTFQGVQVDGKTLAKSNYTAEEGSTVVYLKAAYLKTLAAGKHTVTILSTAGNTSMDFTIGGKSSSPQTFDAGIGIYAVTAVLSVTGMAWTAKKRH